MLGCPCQRAIVCPRIPLVDILDLSRSCLERVQVAGVDCLHEAEDDENRPKQAKEHRRHPQFPVPVVWRRSGRNGRWQGRRRAHGRHGRRCWKRRRGRRVRGRRRRRWRRLRGREARCVVGAGAVDIVLRTLEGIGHVVGGGAKGVRVRSGRGTRGVGGRFVQKERPVSVDADCAHGRRWRRGRWRRGRRSGRGCFRSGNRGKTDEGRDKERPSVGLHCNGTTTTFLEKHHRHDGGGDALETPLFPSFCKVLLHVSYNPNTAVSMLSIAPHAPQPIKNVCTRRTRIP